MEEKTILVADGDARTRADIRILLTEENHRVIEAETGPQALTKLTGEVDLVILDLLLPEFSGLRVCEKIRTFSTVPILFLIPREQEKESISALAAGGDDCICTPFSSAEFQVRVNTLLRRYCVYRGRAQEAARKEEAALSHGRIKLSLEENRVWVRGREVNLTDTEYRILRLLMEDPHRAFPAGLIYERVWGKPDPGPGRPVMVHIRNLRTKLEADPSHPQYLKTVWGRGYRFEVSSHRRKA